MKLSLFQLLIALVSAHVVAGAGEDAAAFLEESALRGSDQNERQLGDCKLTTAEANRWCQEIRKAPDGMGDFAVHTGGNVCKKVKDDCGCKSGYSKSSDRKMCCAHSGANHCRTYDENAVVPYGWTPGCYNHFSDCDCKHGYHKKWQHERGREMCVCDKECADFEEGPAKASPKDGVCPTSWDDCECPEGEVKKGGRWNMCIPVTRSPVTLSPVTRSPVTRSPVTHVPTTRAPVPTTPTRPAPTPSDPWSYGDPHFRTWHGHDFEFHGECDLVMVKAPSMDLDIHVRTTIRYDYSFISHAAVRIGDDVFEVASFGEYQLNGMSTIDLPAKMGDYLVTVDHVNKRKQKFYIHLDNEVDIEIVSFKDYVSVKIEHGGADMFHDVSGMMGHYKTDVLFARDGQSSMDLNEPNLIGQEWQVRPEVDGQLFSFARFPQFPATCVLPAATAIHARARKLGESNVSHAGAEEACAGVQQSIRANCIEDVMKTQDVEIAQSY